jgi:hypothetical protein
MSGDNDSKGESLPEQDEGYAVGWGKPPRHTRFKKGQSGNPKGRPPGSKNMNTLLAKALDEQVTARHKGKLKKFAMREAIPRQLVNKAASGDLRAIQLLFVLMPKVEASSLEQRRRAPEPPTDKSYWAAVLSTLHQCGALDHAFDHAPPLIKQALANADWERIEELGKQWPPDASSKEDDDE